MNPANLLSPNDVADALGVSVQTLASWRSNGRYDLPFVKIGRLVRYRKSAVEEFIDESDRDSEADENDEDFDDESDDDSADDSADDGEEE